MAFAPCASWKYLKLSSELKLVGIWRSLETPLAFSQSFSYLAQQKQDRELMSFLGQNQRCEVQSMRRKLVCCSSCCWELRKDAASLLTPAPAVALRQDGSGEGSRSPFWGVECHAQWCLDATPGSALTNHTRRCPGDRTRVDRVQGTRCSISQAPTCPHPEFQPRRPARQVERTGPGAHPRRPRRANIQLDAGWCCRAAPRQTCCAQGAVGVSLG